MSHRVTAPKHGEGALVAELKTEGQDYDHEGFTMGSDDDGSESTGSSSSSSSSSIPSKYTFYHPLPRNAQSGFVVRVDSKNQSVDSIGQNNPRSSEPFGVDDPPPLSPIEELEDDFYIPRPGEKPESIDAAPGPQDPGTINLERRSQLLFSRQHLELILAHSELSSRFTSFLRTYRPDSVPLLVYLLDSVKALKAIRYAEAIIRGLEPVSGFEFTTEANGATMSWVIEDKADRALEVLVKDDLPAFIAYIYVRTVDIALVSRVTRKEDPISRSLADGLAEVFVLSDPSQPDNPIVFASEEFHQMTQYPRSYALGRNCRFLGGPRTDTQGVARFRASLDAEREHCEVLLNYRKDGSPFINLVMCVPLRDQYGKVRYFLGAQLDITGLVMECTELESLQKLVEQQGTKLGIDGNASTAAENHQQDAFEQLSETFNPRELETLLASRQRHRPSTVEERDTTAEFIRRSVQNVTLKSSSTNLNSIFQLNGQGSAPPLGFYQNYLLVRPHPSLRILFASPDLRVAGILQAPLISQIGGSPRVRDDLARALEAGRKVTAKVQWISKANNNTRSKWIHCTPLLGVNGLIAVWMVILVDDDDDRTSRNQAPVDTPAGSPKGSNASEVLPWDSMKEAGPSSTLRNPAAATSTSPNASQARFVDQSGSRLRNHAPEVPERNRLRKERPIPERLSSDSSNDPRATSAKIAPFATHTDSRYNVTIWSESRDSKTDLSQESRPKPGRPRFGEPPDVVGSNVPHFAARPGPRINGVAYSFNSASEHGISSEDGAAQGDDDSRPVSRSSSFAPSRRPAPPIHSPGSVGSSGQSKADEKPPTRKTYKSLSPYGILFDD